MIFNIAMAGLSIFKGFANKQAYEQQAEISERNAQYASELAVNNAEIEKNNQQMKNRENFELIRRRQAIQKASYATSGVLLDGTPSQYLSAQVESDELNMQRQDQASYAKQMNILYAGQREATSLMNQADAYKSSADMALLGGFLSGGASIGKGIDVGREFSWFDNSGGNASTDLTGGVYDNLSLSDGLPKTIISDEYSPLGLGG